MATATRKGVLTVCYGRGVRFDEAYCTTKHIPMVGRVRAPLGLERADPSMTAIGLLSG
jgi:hypothetical protein